MPHKSQLKRCVMLWPQILALFICFFFCCSKIYVIVGQRLFLFSLHFFVIGFTPAIGVQACSCLIFTKTPILCTLTLNLHIHRGSWWILLILFFLWPNYRRRFHIANPEFALPGSCKISGLGIGLDPQDAADYPSAHNCERAK